MPWNFNEFMTDAHFTIGELMDCMTRFSVYIGTRYNIALNSDDINIRNSNDVVAPVYFVTFECSRRSDCLVPK